MPGGQGPESRPPDGDHVGLSHPGTTLAERTDPWALVDLGPTRSFLCRSESLVLFLMSCPRARREIRCRRPPPPPCRRRCRCRVKTPLASAPPSHAHRCLLRCRSPRSKI